MEHGQYQDIGARSNHRYELLSSDFSRLYRRYYRLQGINVDIKPEVNVDNWLNTTSPTFNPTIAEAIFHYAPRAEAGERFELCISTPEMRSATIKFVHRKQLILDGTFGLSASRLLVWIAMGVNEGNHGVPVALFLFSAPSGAKATHAGYDTSILTKLLSKWNDSFTPGQLEPAVAITDTDTKERGALINVWPRITLLLCRFHLRQCWTNKRNSLFGTKNETSFFKEKALRCIRDLDTLYVHFNFGETAAERRLPSLLSTTTRPATLERLQSDRETFKEMLADPKSKSSGQGGLKYIEYIEATWMPQSLWNSWSEEGRSHAAAVLGVDISNVLPTTNHLESFNGVLKRKHIGQWQRSGQKLRFDVLVFRLVLYIMPNIYAQFRLTHSFEAWKKERFANVAGAHEISRQIRTVGNTVQVPSSTVTWYSPDPIRDGFAKDIIRLHLITPIQSMKPFEMWATCASTGANTSDPDHPRYWLTAHPSGHATCTCADWLNRGGACKHLRAFRNLITSWIQNGQIGHKFHFPESQLDACDVLDRNKHWYGHYYEHSVMAPASQDTMSPTRPPTLYESSTRVPLPPPNLPEVSLIPTMDQEAELEESIANLGDTVDLGSNLSIGPSTKLFNNHEAIAIQNQQRLDHFITASLPKLYGISNLLQDFRPSVVNNEFSSLVTTLSQQLASIALGSDPDPPSSATLALPIRHLGVAQASNTSRSQANTPSPPQTPAKRFALLPPSPEAKKSTKRIKSYSTL